MSSSQSYTSGFGSNHNSNNINNSNVMSSGFATSSFGNSSGWNAFASAGAPTPTLPPQQHQPKPDLSAFDSLLPMSKPKPTMSTMKPAMPSAPNYMSASFNNLPAPTSSSNGILMPQSSLSSFPTSSQSNVKSLSPSDINDLLS